MVVTVDLSRPDGPGHLAQATAELDVGLLVSNAGDLLPGEFLGRDLHHAVQSLHLNAYSHLTLAHHFGNRFSERGKGGSVSATPSQSRRISGRTMAAVSSQTDRK